MTISAITPLPQAPQVTDAPSVFSQRANTFVAALAQLVTETNATTNEINQALAGALVLFDGYKGDWESGSFGAGDVVRKNDVFYVSLVDANTQEPPGSDWQELNTAVSIAYNNTESGLDATNVQTAIDKASTALSTTFDPSNVALTGETVQAGIEQLCTLPTAQKTDNYTLAKSDTGGLISISTGTITIPSGVFDIGDTIVLYNNAGTTRTIVRAFGVTLFWVNGVNADRSLLQRGIATVVCVGSNQFVITGQGLQ